MSEVTFWRVDDDALVGRLTYATSIRQRTQGLIGTRELAPDAGIYFPHDVSLHMWFMSLPIDAVFVGRALADGSLPIVAVRRHLRPWLSLVLWVRDAHGTLELADGTIDRLGLAVGQALRTA